MFFCEFGEVFETPFIIKPPLVATSVFPELFETVANSFKSFLMSSILELKATKFIVLSQQNLYLKAVKLNQVKLCES